MYAQNEVIPDYCKLNTQLFVLFLGIKWNCRVIGQQGKIYHETVYKILISKVINLNSTSRSSTVMMDVA